MRESLVRGVLAGHESARALLCPADMSRCAFQPGLVLVPGEDLTPYRKASAGVFAVLSEFGAAAQKLGMDEVRRV